MRASLVDISRYQGMIDASKIKAAGFCGIIARCTIGFMEDGSSVGKGLDFYKNSQKQARDNGLIFGAYHVLWPSNKAPIREADNFLGKCGDIDLAVLDVELLGGQTLAQVQGQSKAWLERVEGVQGKKPWVYTGSWFWTSPAGWENEYPLIEAEYIISQPRGGIDRTQQPEPPKVPTSKGWNSWAMWQWTSGGKPLGASSESMDYDCVNGTEEQFRTFLGLQPPPPSLEERVGKLEAEARIRGWGV